MDQRWMALHSFGADPALKAIRLEALAGWQNQWLKLQLRLNDPRGLVHCPAACAEPERRDGLWENTCFEAFFSEPETDHYWELNLSPSGHWNVYRLSSYREGLTPERSISSVPYSLRRLRGLVEVNLSLNLQSLLPKHSDLDLSITSVLVHAGREHSYWALQHCGSAPDFHRRESFLRLPCEEQATAQKQRSQSGNETVVSGGACIHP